MRPKEYLGDFHKVFNYRGDEFLNEIRRSCIDSEMAQYSIHSEIPAFSCLKRGLFDSFVYTPANILHLLFSNGLVMYFLEFIL